MRSCGESAWSSDPLANASPACRACLDLVYRSPRKSRSACQSEFAERGAQSAWKRRSRALWGFRVGLMLLEARARKVGWRLSGQSFWWARGARRFARQRHLNGNANRLSLGARSMNALTARFPCKAPKSRSSDRESRGRDHPLAFRHRILTVPLVIVNFTSIPGSSTCPQALGWSRPQAGLRSKKSSALGRIRRGRGPRTGSRLLRASWWTLGPAVPSDSGVSRWMRGYAVSPGGGWASSRIRLRALTRSSVTGLAC